VGLIGEKLMHVLLIDDHTMFREGLRLILGNLYGELPILEADSCEKAADFANDEEPIDIVLLDMQLPGVSDVGAVKMIRAMFAEARVVVVSGHCTPERVRDAIDAGAMGYISKASNSELLKSALGVVVAGGVYLPAEVLLAARAVGESGGAVQRDVLTQLTDRQRDVLRLLVLGNRNKRIARLLDIGEATVKTHVAAVLRAFGAETRSEVVYTVGRLGLRLE
jgi:DNA-binding NarL/FixJ family response regulator